MHPITYKLLEVLIWGTVGLVVAAVVFGLFLKFMGELGDALEAGRQAKEAKRNGTK